MGRKSHNNIQNLRLESGHCMLRLKNNLTKSVNNNFAAQFDVMKDINNLEEKTDVEH